MVVRALIAPLPPYMEAECDYNISPMDIDRDARTNRARAERGESSTPLLPQSGGAICHDNTITTLPTRKIINEFPRMSMITGAHDHQLSGTYSTLPTVRNTVAKREREEFVRSLPTRVRVKLDQKFGKENRNQCFVSAACLRHVLIPLYKSGFLVEPHGWDNFRKAFHMVEIFLTLWNEHSSVNFAEIQGFHKGWDEAAEIDQTRVRMATAALLHFDGNIADTVRWIGGLTWANTAIT